MQRLSLPEMSPSLCRAARVPTGRPRRTSRTAMSFCRTLSAARKNDGQRWKGRRRERTHKSGQSWLRYSYGRQPWEGRCAERRWGRRGRRLFEKKKVSLGFFTLLRQQGIDTPLATLINWMVSRLPYEEKVFSEEKKAGERTEKKGRTLASTLFLPAAL
jgi:hypothetical protein